MMHCYDCARPLRKGEGKYEERRGKLRVVCRDREECEYRRSLWEQRSAPEWQAPRWQQPEQ